MMRVEPYHPADQPDFVCIIEPGTVCSHMHNTVMHTLLHTERQGNRDKFSPFYSEQSIIAIESRILKGSILSASPAEIVLT